MRPLALSLLLPFTLAAQLRVAAVDSATGAETTITGAVFSVGNPGPADEVRTRFKIYNTTSAPITIQRVRVSGTGFSMVEPSPTVVASGRSLDVAVLFQAARSGGYSANFTADSFSVLLTANVVNAPTLTLTRGGTPLSAGATIDLGTATAGQTASRTVWLENREGTSLTVRSLRVTGDSGLSLAAGTPSTLSIAGNQAESVEIRFQPTGASRRYAGNFVVDGRTFVLTAIGTDPPLPRPSIEIDGVSASGQSPKLSVQFATVPETDVNGTLKMEFQPRVTGTPDDPAIRFLSSNGRNLPVQVRRGQAKAFFGSAANAAQEATFQTGSTAGTITWTLELGSFKEVRTIDLAPAAATVAEALAVRRVQDLDITLTGFDNTRSMDQLLFTFYDTSGRQVPPGAIRADVKQDFSRFFAASATGGVFTLRASFPVSGPVAQIGSVEVELINSSGSARTQRLQIAGN